MRAIGTGSSRRRRRCGQIILILVVGGGWYPVPFPPSVWKAHQNILDLAKAHHREVWFDVHLGTEGPAIWDDFPAGCAYGEALASMAEGALFRNRSHLK